MIRKFSQKLGIKILNSSLSTIKIMIKIDPVSPRDERQYDYISSDWIINLNQKL